MVCVLYHFINSPDLYQLKFFESVDICHGYLKLDQDMKLGPVLSPGKETSSD